MAALSDKNNGIVSEMYAKHKVNRGLRDMSGNGVVTGLTEVSKIKAKEINEFGEAIPCEGQLCFRGIDVRDLVNGMGEDVPADVHRIADGLPYRDYITVGLLVDKLLLENKTKVKTLTGNVPDCWIYVQEREVRLGRLQIFNNWSPYLVADPENTVWIGLEYFCNEGDELWEMGDKDFIDFAIAELAKIDVIDPADVKDATRIKVKKAYPAYFDTYTEFDTVKSYLSGIDNLWCLGRNGQHRYNNMDHSMLTAVEAVRSIANGSRDKATVWAVNTEKEYHEEKTEGENNK